jgi:hypothetical protein
MHLLLHERINHLRALTEEVAQSAYTLLSNGPPPDRQRAAEKALRSMVRTVKLIAKGGRPPLWEGITDPDRWWADFKALARNVVTLAWRLWEQTHRAALNPPPRPGADATAEALGEWNGRYGRWHDDAFATYGRNRQAVYEGHSRLFTEACRTRPVRTATTPPTAAYLFKADGKLWHVRFGGEQGHYNQDTDLGRVLRLFKSQGQPIPVQQLADYDQRSARIVPGAKKEPALDPEAYKRAKAEYDDLAQQLEEARKNGDSYKVSVLQEKVADMEQRLSNDTFGGKAKRIGPRSPDEKARNTVERSIRRAQQELAVAMPGLAEHIRQHVRPEPDGTAYAYRPTQPVPWEF